MATAPAAAAARVASAPQDEPLPVASSSDAIPTSLDRASFRQDVSLWALRVPRSTCAALLKALRGAGGRWAFNRPRLRTIVPDPSSAEPDGGPMRLLLLNEEQFPRTPDAAPPGLDALPAAFRSLLPTGAGLIPVPYSLSLCYEDLPAETILRRLLPAGVDIPSAFETIGHVAHLNLRDEQLPYKTLIAEVLIDKNSPRIRTVVNKVGTIESEFRVPQLELLAGDPSTETEVRQHGLLFRLDYAEVYWNSRLEAEHKRLVDSFPKGAHVADLMAGIGPFAVPAALQGCEVYANDLNPKSAHYLRVNAALNKVGARLRVFNMDARAFLRLLIRGSSADTPAPAPAAGLTGAAAPSTSGPVLSGPVVIQHVIMNLPASAPEFLDAFRGAFGPEWRGPAALPLPRVHCYCFARGNASGTDADGREAAVVRAEAALGGLIDRSTLSIVEVRNVAPKKTMLCLSFIVPAAVAFAGQQGAEGEAADAGAGAGTVRGLASEAGGAAAKRVRTEL